MSFIPAARTSLSRTLVSVRMYSGELGSGAGKGGGGGGSIRAAGGAFGKLEAGREEEYFHRKQRAQLEKLRSHLDAEISHHEDAIRRHEEAIKRHRSQITDIEHKK